MIVVQSRWRVGWEGGAIARTATTALPVWVRLSFALLLVVAVALQVIPTAAQEVPELRINSKRYLVLDAETGEVFAQRGAHETVAMASLTKVFTAIEAIEAAPGEIEITTTSSDMVSDQASTMGFGPGEVFTLQELLLGMMLPSGNDAARAIARSLGAQPGDGDEQALERFMARLNQRVRDMGLRETTLINPDGWGVPGHHSSAHDLAVFTMYALRYPRFVELISTSEFETMAGYRLRNNNRLLNNYDGLIGGKTGYDDDAGWCLIEVAERDGSRMISVTLDGVAPEDWYDDNRVLLDYAFEQKAARSAAGQGGSGERVGYLDPDAAVVGRVAAAGASVGAQGTGPAVAPPPAVAVGPALDTASRPVVGVAADGDSGRRFWTAVGVAAVLVLGGASRAFRQPRPGLVAETGAVPRSRRPTTATTGLPPRRDDLTSRTAPPILSGKTK